MEKRSNIVSFFIILSSGFRNISFKHCNKEANEVDHALARFIFTDHVDLFWDGDPRSFLLPKLINDVSLFENQ
jgi:hypothetical protein